jgi:LuxR family maltose regulon positive regulatory protein
MRSRIHERLARATQFPVTLIVAPAGFGKTVALRDFIATARLDVLRYDVPREDNSLLAFARGLANTLNVPANALDATSAVATIAELFVAHLRRVVTTIVIDDLHHAADSRCAELIVTLIERTSGKINWIIATRSDADLPVASWLGYGRLDLPIGEDELVFTPEEALAAGFEAAASIEAAEVDALCELTGGWPVALSIALRTRTHATDLRAATDGAREMVYRYLAEQIFAGLDDAQRAFLLDTSVLPSFDMAIVLALERSAEFLAELRRDASFLGETAPGIFRYHDLFRDFLSAQLQRSGTARWRDAHLRAARVLEERGEFARALDLLAQAGDANGVAAMLRARGTDLFERGEAETLGRALAVVSDNAYLSDARILGVKAIVEAGRGHFDLAERDFLEAIARADDSGTRLMLVHRYALELIRHDRDAIALLAPFESDGEIAAASRVPLLGTYATALARAGMVAQAVETLAATAAVIDASVRDDARARFYQQAAFVHQLLPERGEARNYANLATDLALANGLYEVAARALSVLYVINHEDGGDPIESLAILDRLIECARKGASVQTGLYGLFASMDIEVDRGDDVAIERLDREIERSRGALPRTAAESVLPARALREAWTGDFARAYELLAPSVDDVRGNDRRALRFAEIALYAAASARPNEAEDAAQRAVAELANVGAITRRGVRTSLLLALTELVRGHAVTAHRFLVEAERALPRSPQRLRTFAQAVRAYYRSTLGESEPLEVRALLERLHAEHYGGMARLLAALPLAGTSDAGGYALLTAAERSILAALAGGKSTKAIAESSGRSAHTIDTHVRSICRKLACRGRREAVALAVRSGWVDS